MIDTCKEIFCLMCDMAEEGIERARIKSQQNRILEIIRVDKKALDSVYCKIGRIDVLGGDKEKRNQLIEEAKKIEARIVRAQIRYEKLKVSASVDECTKAFEEKIAQTVKSVQQAANEKAKDFAENAKEKSADISEKIKTATQDLSSKAKAQAEDLTIKAKDKAEDLKIKAKDKAEDISESAKKKADKAKEKGKEVASKAKEKLPKSAPEKVAEDIKADNTVIENTEDILKRIQDAIDSVDDSEAAENFSF